MRIFVLLTILIGIGYIVNGQQTAPDQHYKLIRGNSMVQTKNYYLLTLAVEMRKFLIEKLNIPENAIIIEPHARHTTTNLRNCVRLIYRYGMPFNKACITTTSGGQSMMITKTLAARCLKELNEVPFQNGKRLSETEAEFYPAIEALHINPTEPLDP